MKEKLYIVIAVLLALLFLTKETASATIVEDEIWGAGDIHALPTTDFELVAHNSTPYGDFYVSFILGTDGVMVDDSERDNTEERSAYQVRSYASNNIVISFDTGALCTVQDGVNAELLYDYDGASIQFNPGIGYMLTYNDNGLDMVLEKSAVVRPYMVLNGEKKYITNGFINEFFIDTTVNALTFHLGAEVEIFFSYDGQVNDTFISQIKTNFGSLDFSLFVPETVYDVYGYRKLSSGEQTLVDHINENTSILGSKLNIIASNLIEHFPVLESSLSSIYTWLDTKFPVLTQTILDFRTSMETQLISANTTLTNTYNFVKGKLDISLTQFRTSLKNYIEGARDSINNQMKSFETNITAFMTGWKTDLSAQLADIKDALMRGYDTSDSDDVSADLDSTLSGYEDAESAVTGEAIENMDEFTIPSDGFGSFDNSFISAVSLVSGMLQSIFVSMGNFGIKISVGFTLTIAAMLTGLFRFFR